MWLLCSLAYAHKSTLDFSMGFLSVRPGHPMSQVEGSFCPTVSLNAVLYISPQELSGNHFLLWEKVEDLIKDTIRMEGKAYSLETSPLRTKPASYLQNSISWLHDSVAEYWEPI